MFLPTKRRLLTAAAALLIAGGLAAGGHARATLAADTTLSIHDLTFDPASVTINAGDTLTWTDNDTAPHDIAADDGSFDLGVMNPGDSVSLTFASAGTFTYHCNIHPQMTGTVTVNGS